MRRHEVIEKLYTAKEAAEILSVQLATIRRWTYERRLTFVRVGGRAVRYRESDLKAMIKVVAALRPVRCDMEMP
jgi:excisionase family DNA binding protein